jgi:hypothetical protein
LKQQKLARCFSRVAITPTCNKPFMMVAGEGIGPSTRSYNECNPNRAFVS